VLIFLLPTMQVVLSLFMTTWIMIMHAWSQSPTYTKTKKVVASSHLFVISRVDCSQNELCNTIHSSVIGTHSWSQSPTYTKTKKVVASSHLFVISRVDCSQNQLCNTFHSSVIGMHACMEPESHYTKTKKVVFLTFLLSVGPIVPKTSCVVHSTLLWSSLYTTKPLTGREGMVTEG